MVIEFLGKSGCGKTTLISTMCDQKYYYPVPKANNVITVLYFILTPRSWQLMYRIIKRCRELDRKDRIKKDFLYLTKLFYISIVYANRSDICLLVDQGLLQFLLSVYFYDSFDDVAEQLVRQIEKLFHPNVVICKCDNETLIQRINNRKNDECARTRRVESFADSTENAMFQAHDAFIDKLSSYIEHKVIVDTAAHKEDAIAKIHAFAERHSN